MTEVKRLGWKLWNTRSILLIATGPSKGRIAITGRITLNHLSTTAMRLMSNYFHHFVFLDAHIDSRTTIHTVLLLLHIISRWFAILCNLSALRAEYCIMFIQHNIAIYSAASKRSLVCRRIHKYPPCWTPSLLKALSTPATMSKQHCRLLQVERFFRQSRILLRHCLCFLATM